MTLSGINASPLFGELSLFKHKASLPYIDVVQKFLSFVKFKFTQQQIKELMSNNQSSLVGGLITP